MYSHIQRLLPVLVVLLDHHVPFFLLRCESSVVTWHWDLQIVICYMFHVVIILSRGYLLMSLDTDHGIVRVGPGCEGPSAAAGAATENHTDKSSDQLQKTQTNLTQDKVILGSV